MEQTNRLFMAFASLTFCLLFIAGILVFGNDMARKCVLGAAFAGAVSQFVAQDRRGHVASIVLAYAGFSFAIVALLLMLFG